MSTDDLLQQDDIGSLVAAAEPLLWFAATCPAFIYTISQRPNQRLWLLPLNLHLPIQWYRTADRLSPYLPGIDWLLAFTSLIYIFHSISVLCVEKIELPVQAPKSGSKGLSSSFDEIRSKMLLGVKAWMNPRQISMLKSEHITSNQRCVFAFRKILSMGGLALVYIVLELTIVLLLTPRPEDFTDSHQRYFHLHVDRQALVRSACAFYWAWLTFVELSIVHSLLAIAFVTILRLDSPEEWPPLFGSPVEASSLRSFWGKFWHKIGSISQLSIGRLLGRKVLRLRPGSSLDKLFSALSVFAMSGLIHLLVARKTEPDADPMSDLVFLLLNFAGGVLEHTISVKSRRMLKGRPRIRGVLGYCWVFLFFYCTVPPYQYPTLHKAARQREKSFGNVLERVNGSI